MKKPIGLACALILGIAGSALYRATLPSLSVRTSSVPQEGPSKVARPMQGNGSRPTHWPVGVLVGAGDIADCANLRGAEATAKLLDRIPGTVFTVGDVVYPRGSDSDFANCYEKTWGRHKARTRPAIGNHEYGTKDATGYFRYFGAAAGEPGKGYYSYDLGAWHIVVINSNCARVGGCEAGSPQEQWLRSDLAAHRSSCTLAYWHHPLFSSGFFPGHAMRPEMRAIWQALYEVGAEIVVNGHEHNYERFGPQDPNGEPDDRRGIREFVVGTGGKNNTPLGAPIANSEVQNDRTFGVLELTLRPDGYDWRFIPITGKMFTDSGSSTCH
jgi:acid phosphatase type 7